MAVESTLDQLTRIKYVGQDFQTYVNESTDFLRVKYPDEYTDWVESNMGIALIQLIGYASQGLAFYMNRRTTDLYMVTAQSPSSISKFSRMLNYTIEASSSAATDITVTLSEGPYSFPVQIVKGFRFITSQGLIYEYRNDETITFNPGDLTKTFTVYEGETRETSFLSDGTENQSFKLVGIPAGQLLVGASLEVYIQNELWTEKNQIPYALGNFYEVNYISSPPIVKFGDGIAGSIPAVNQEVRIRYSHCNGRNGRIGSGQITAPVDPLVARNTEIPLTVTNPSPSNGGEDYEDLRKVKSLAPEFFQSQDRAISVRDYNAIANTYPGIAKANTHVVRGVEDDYYINFYADRILSTVETGVSGIIVESTPYLNTINSDLAAIVSGVGVLEAQLLADIAPLVSGVQGEVAAIQTGVSGVVVDLLNNIQPYWDGIATDIADISSAMASEGVLFDGDIAAHQSVIGSLVSLINDTVSGCGGGIPSTVAGYGTSINGSVSDIRNAVNTRYTNLTTTISGYTTSIQNRASTIQGYLANLGSDIDSQFTTHVPIINNYLAGISTAVSARTGAFTTSVSGYVMDMSAQVSGINEVFVNHSADIVDAVNSDMASLLDYLNESLTTSCTANIIQVQILQVDSNNNYVAPTSGIMEELRAHLQDRADAVHVVRVIDGSVDIVYVDVDVGIKVASTSIESEVRDKAEASLIKYDTQPYGILVLRDYGKSLYRYDINKAIRDAQLKDADIEYANVDITYPTDKLDYKGNLIISNTEVIVPRTITVHVL